jgi:hypothetical protein
VVSTFDVTPAQAPPIVSPEHRRVITGPELKVRFHATGGMREEVSLVRHGGSGRHLRKVSTQLHADGVVTLRTRHLHPGRYHVVLTDVAGHRTEASAPVWVYRPGSPSRIRTDRHTYRVGSPIRVSWTRAPGTNLDWVSLFPCHVRCAGPGGYTIYRYTKTAVEGALTFGRRNYLGYGSVNSLAPGVYVARVLVDDGYHAIGVSPRFRIVRR